MTVLKFLWSLWGSHGTRILGTITTIVSGLLLIPELIEPGVVKYWHALNVILGALTVGRGYSNAAANGPQP